MSPDVREAAGGPVGSVTDEALVSVVTPCYNAAEFIAETIESVRAQSYPRVEHIVVDDGSRDGSWAVVESFGPSVIGARLERNGGASHARNVGAALARGQYLMFLDADDLLAPDTIAALVAAVSTEPAAAAVCRWDRLRRVHGTWARVPAAIRFPPPPDPLRGWLERAWVPPCAVLWRREVYDATGGWDEELSLNDDGDLMMRALARGMRLVVARGGCAHYRTYGGTARDGTYESSRLSLSMNVYAERNLRSQMRVLEKLTAEVARAGRLAELSPVIGSTYLRTYVSAWRLGFRRAAEECLRRGEALGGVPPVPPTLPGRALQRLVGLRRKERITAALARFGVMLPVRRRALRFHRRQAAMAAEQCHPADGLGTGRTGEAR